MNDVQHSQLLGRCFLSEDDKIGSVGTLCKIMESRKLESGKGFFVIEAKYRFRIISIEQSVPYTTATVELDYVDDVVPDEKVPAVVRLWNAIYHNLKIYLRIARLYANTLKNNGYNEIVGEAYNALVDVHSVEVTRLQREISRIESRMKNKQAEIGDEEKLMALREVVTGFQQMMSVDSTGVDSRESEDESRYLHNTDEARKDIAGSVDFIDQAASEASYNGEAEDALDQRHEQAGDQEDLDAEMEYLSREVIDSKPLHEAKLANGECRHYIAHNGFQLRRSKSPIDRRVRDAAAIAEHRPYIQTERA